MSSVVLDVCLVVCINLGPKSAISRGEQNRYGWRRRTLLTARLIKFYGGLWRLTAAAMGSTFAGSKLYQTYAATRKPDRTSDPMLSGLS